MFAFILLVCYNITRFEGEIMNKELKRRIYAIALSGIILAGPKMKAYAE